MRNKFVVPTLTTLFALTLLFSAFAAPAQAQAGGPSPRVGASLVNVDGRIFLFGGSSTAIFGNVSGGKLAAPALRPLFAEFGDLWEFNNENGNFSEIDISGASPAPRHGHAAASAGGKMYIFGGQGAEGQLYDSWVYDPAANTWKEQDLSGENPKDVFQPGSTAIGLDDDTILIVNGDGSVYAYLISEELVGQVTADPLPVKLKQPSIGERNGRPLIFGGWDSGVNAKNPNAYLFSKQWRSIPCTGESLALESATVVSQGNTVWVIGGLGEGLRGDILQIGINEALNECDAKKVASNILDYGRLNASAVLLPGSTESNPRILLFGGDTGGEIVGNPIVIELGEPAPSPTPTGTPTQLPAPQSSPIPSETPRSPVGEEPSIPEVEVGISPLERMLKFFCNPCGSAPALLLLVMMLLAKRR